MTTNQGTEKPEDKWQFTYDIPKGWVSYITYAVSGAITSVVAVVITAIVIILVLLGGLWLAYTYLPAQVFYIILAVLVADVVLGFVLRKALSRK